MSKLMIKGTEVGFDLEDANVESTLLASTTATSATTYTVNDLSQYDFIMVNLTFTNAIDSFFNTVTIPVLDFKRASNAVQVTHANATYRAIAKYISDTSVSLYILGNTSKAELYGIKIKAMALPVKEMHHYSTDEQVVGTWIDGKTLYEKSYQILNYDKVGWNKSGLLLPEGCEMVKKINTTVSDYNGNVFPEYNINNSDMLRSYFYGGEHFLTVGTNYPERPFNIYITIKYTKTTD